VIVTASTLHVPHVIDRDLCDVCGRPGNSIPHDEPEAGIPKRRSEILKVVR
jgi:hypothetical protein